MLRDQQFRRVLPLIGVLPAGGTRGQLRDSLITQIDSSCSHDLQMLVETAPVFIRFPAVLALQIAGCRLLLLRQVCTVARPTRAILRLVLALERRQ